MQNKHTCVVVLAAGDGKRLSTLTAEITGMLVPKQFCSVHGPSLLGLALARAKSLVPEDRVCAVVAKAHEHWWRPMVDEMRAGKRNGAPKLSLISSMNSPFG